MDKLRHEGMLFSNFHVSAVSAPTRAALMTGRYAYRTGVTGVNQSRVNMFEDEITIAEYLKKAKYATGLFGKWHLGYNYPMRPIDQGFDEYCSWEEMQFYRTDPVMEENGINKQYRGSFLTDVIFEKAIDFMGRKSKDNKPFFMYLATYLPHTHHDGIQVPFSYVEPYEKIKSLSWHTQQTYGMISKVDEQLGKLLFQIKELGIDDNTLIIFGTDNGPAACYPGQVRDCQNRYNANLRGMKGSPYEGGICTPWIFKWNNKIEANSECRRFSAHVDVLPTILDLLGIPIHKEKPIDGNSLKSLLLNSDDVVHPTRYYYQFIPNVILSEIRSQEWSGNSCYIENDIKLVEGREVYDLKSDPYEKFDLAKNRSGLLDTLRNRCSAFRDDLLDVRNLKYQPNIIGSFKQNTVNLMYHEIIPFEKGWPVRIVKRSKYEIGIHDIQYNDIAPGAFWVIEAKGEKWKQPVIKGMSHLYFKDINLPLGDYFLKIYIEGDIFPKQFNTWDMRQGRYHRMEYGHRLVTVKDQSVKMSSGITSSIDLYDGLLD